MPFYKLESRYRYKTNYNKLSNKIYKYWFSSFDDLTPQLRYELSLGAKCTLKEINEKEYMKGIENGKK